MRDIGLYLSVAMLAIGILLAERYAFPSLYFVFALSFALAVLTWSAIARRPVALVVALTLAALATGGLRTAPRELPPSLRPHLEERLTLQGTIVTLPDERETNTRLTLLVEHGGMDTRVIAVVPSHGRYRVGDEVTAMGTLTLPESFETAGGRTFAYDDFLAKDGVFALMESASVEVVGRSASMPLRIMRSLQSVRDAFMEALARALPEPESALAAGLIAGGKQGLGKELVDVFTVAGLIHIVVLSGYNIAIVAGAVLKGTTFLPGKIGAIAAGTTIALFVLAAGAGAAAVRAGLMALLGLLTLTLNRPYVVMRALILSLALMLAHNPFLLMHDPGFQFSFIATAGLILFADPLIRLLSFVPGTAFRELVAATFAAQIAVLPILLFHTGNLSFVSFLVNLAILPIVPLAMGLGTVAAGVALLLPSFLDPIVLFVGLPARILLSCIIVVAEIGAGLPFANVVVPRFPFPATVLAYAGLALLWVHMTNGARGSPRAPFLPT